MKRNDCEQMLINLVQMAFDIYRQYDPEGKYLMLCADEDGYISVNSGICEGTTGSNQRLDASRYTNGNIRLSKDELIEEAI